MEPGRHAVKVPELAYTYERNVQVLPTFAMIAGQGASPVPPHRRKKCPRSGPCRPRVDMGSRNRATTGARYSQDVHTGARPVHRFGRWPPDPPLTLLAM